MVRILLLQVNEAKEWLSIENVTVYGVLFLIIGGLIYHIKSTEKKHEKEKEILREEVKSAQLRLDEEYKQSNEEMKKLAENYHVFTTRIFEKLNTLIK